MSTTKPSVVAKCIGCGKQRVIDAGEIPAGDHPACDVCFMPLVPVGAKAANKHDRNGEPS